MKKLILMVVMAVAMLVGCGNKPEPVTEADVVGYWMDEDNNLYKIAEGGMFYVYAPMKLGDEVIGQVPYPMGMIACLDGKVTVTIEGETGELAVSEDKDTLSTEHVTWTRISKEQAAGMGVDVDAE